ncbi:MAG: DUF3800 domain-containing protein [bacterium]
MYLCYVDESGTPDIPGNTSHFILAGLSIPVDRWRDCDAAVNAIKHRYDLDAAEIHVAWLMRAYREQDQITNFAGMDRTRRRAMVASQRTTTLHRILSTNNRNLYRQTKKNYTQTAAYTHLTRTERIALVQEFAACIAGWRFARLFAECVDKAHFVAQVRGKSVDEQAFEQIVSRFEQYLQNMGRPAGDTRYGLLIHDNNQTVARRHTELMKRFHASGTLWTGINSLIETPLFVDSQLTGMIQVADLCGYALRRYLENDETPLFDQVFQRADRVGNTVVGVRHFTKLACTCRICAAHRRTVGNTPNN